MGKIPISITLRPQTRYDEISRGETVMRRKCTSSPAARLPAAGLPTVILPTAKPPMAELPAAKLSRGEKFVWLDWDFPSCGITDSKNHSPKKIQ